MNYSIKTRQKIVTVTLKSFVVNHKTECELDKQPSRFPNILTQLQYISVVLSFEKNTHDIYTLRV